MKAAGICCMAYYILMAFYTGKLNSTFAGFWLVFGSFLLVLGFVYPGMPGIIKTIVQLFLAAGAVIFFWIESRILLCMHRYAEKGPDKADVMIILGAQVRGTKITNSLKRRLDAACKYLKIYPDTKVIVSGGKGPGEEISEAQAMKDYLTENHIPPACILKEDKSTTTRENLSFSAGYAGGYNKTTVVVTNNFHLYRALFIGRALGYTQLSGLAATSNPVLFVNYMVREFFAVLLIRCQNRGK